MISPMLITFLELPAYDAVGIALASDVLASAVSAYTYGKNRNLDIRNVLAASNPAGYRLHRLSSGRSPRRIQPAGRRLQQMFQFIICFIAGLGAGLGTGFAGMSAAAVISPMLITFLELPAYDAVGIALASDVLASAIQPAGRPLTAVLPAAPPHSLRSGTPARHRTASGSRPAPPPPEHFARVDAAARKSGHTALISAGWDPGMFSLNRLYAGAILPEGKDYTFWGRGVSQGHSDAVRAQATSTLEVNSGFESSFSRYSITCRFSFSQPVTPLRITKPPCGMPP